MKRLQTLRIVLLAVPLAMLPSCFQFELSAQAGYAQLALDGDVGYANSDGAAVQQDVENAFGLGDDRGSPYARVELDTGLQVFSVSGFTFDETGDGVLQAQFGDSPILVAGVPVTSDLELTNIKGAYAFEIGLGPVSISPGIAVDWFDLDLTVADQIGIATERVELNGPVPLAFLRGELDLGLVAARAEVGYMEVEIDDVDGSFLDLEAMLMLRPTPLIDVFVGYRSLALDVDGRVDGDAFDTDLTVGGFLIGGGIRF